MKLGPIVAPSIVVTSPLKNLHTAAAASKNAIAFGGTTPYSVTGDVLQYSTQISVFGATPSASRATIAQILELVSNSDWQRAGIYVTNREDGVNDAQDGWYVLDTTDIPEITLDLGWAAATVDFMLRARREVDLGVYVDAKAVSNDLSLSGTTLAVMPGGTTAGYPLATWSFAAADGSTVLAVENPSTTMRAPFSNPTNCMTQQRCAVLDDDLGTTSTEVFGVDHRWLNGNVRIHNGLVRYTINVTTPGQPLVEVWTGAAWTTIGSYRLQAYNGSTYTTLPVQATKLTLVSPEEVMWEERRYDTGGVAYVRTVNRIRRGSRLIECQVVTASGLGLTGAQSVALTGTGGSAAALTADGSGSVCTGAASALPGFAYLSPVPAAVTFGSTNFYSGITVPAGTVARFNILAGYQDAMYTSLTTAALYAQRWAAYSRTRVKQRILV